MTPTGQFSIERREVEAILASGAFDRSPGLAQLLAYVCEKYFAGEADQLKEYTIAVEALGRTADFDQKRDSIIRVQFHRLRERLSEYYAGDGSDHPVKIVIPQGRYAPKFIHRDESAPAGLAESNGEVALLEAKSEGVAQPLQRPADSSGERMEAAGLAPDLPVEIAKLAEPEPQKKPPYADEAITPPPPDSNSAVWKWLLAAGLTLVAVVIAVSLLVTRQGVTEPSEQAITPASLPSGESIRILAGLAEGSFTDGAGKLWLSDRYFQGGEVVSLPNQPIWGTRDPRLYRSRRQGDFRYDIPLKPGVYEMRLHFAETFFGETNAAGYGGENSRTFIILANGKALVNRVDVAGEVGVNVAQVKTFKDISPAEDGMLHLSFDRIKDQPFISAIEITPGLPGRLVPIRLVAQSRGYTDPKGQYWEPDRLAVGGQLVARPVPVTGTPYPELFEGERFGNFSYSIAVPPGRYTVVLYTAEKYHIPQARSEGVVVRQFDIRCNGIALVKSIDVLARAGGPNRAFVQRFQGIEPDYAGNIVLSFVRAKSFAIINALEVLDEAKAPQR